MDYAILEICLVFGSSGSTSGVIGYTSFDYGEDLLRRRSLTCYVFLQLLSLQLNLNICH